MVSPFSQFFQKNGGGPPAEPAGNKDLECGYGTPVPVPQTPTASGYQSSPSRVYLPETRSINTPTVPQTPTPNPEHFSHVQYNGSYESAAQVPLTPSGPPKVLGYLPRTTYSGSSPFVHPTRLIIPSQPSQHASNIDFVSDGGPQRSSKSISSTSSHRSLSPRSPFDPGKHGQALRRLETHGSLKTIPSGQQEDDAFNRTSISWSEIGREVFKEDHTVGLQGSLSQQPGSLSSADQYGTIDQQLGADLSSSAIQYLPNSVYQPAVPSQGDSSKAVDLPDPPIIEDGQSLREALPSFVFPLSNAEADTSSQVTQQALHQSQVLPKPHQSQHRKSSSRESINPDASPDLWSKYPSSERLSENDIMGSIVQEYVTHGSELFEDMSAYEAEGEDSKQRPSGNPIPKQTHPDHHFVQSPTLEEIDEYTWSPAPSDDGQDASSVPRTPLPCHPPSDALQIFPISRLTSHSYDGFSRSSESYGDEHVPSQSSSSGNPRVIDSSLPRIDVLIPAGNIDLDSHSDFLSSSQHKSTIGSRESSGILFRYSGIITDGVSSRPMSEIELKEEVLNSLGDRAKAGLSILSSRNSSSQTDQIRGVHKPNDRLQAFQLDGTKNLSADVGPGSSQTSSSLSTDHRGGDIFGPKARLGNHDSLPSSRIRCPTPPLLFGRNAISKPEQSSTTSRPALEPTFNRFNQNVKAVRLNETGRMPTVLGSLGEQDWETVSAKSEANTHTFGGIAFDTKAGSSLADNSDSGSLSLSKETSYPFQGVQARPVLQHPAHPRHNHSFMLLKNSQTGDLVQVPQYEYASGGRLPNSNASAPLVSKVRADSTYQHPPPLPLKHNHPFSSSPPAIRFPTLSATSIDSDVVTQQNLLDSESSSPGPSEVVQEFKENQTQNPLCKTTQDKFRVRGPTVDQNQHELESKEQSHLSSAWLSTVSEVTSSEPSLPGNGDAFSKMIVWKANGRVNGTPEQRGSREVGSSLADASSPGANFSSSPTPLTSSPILILDTPPSLRQGLHEQAVRDNFDNGSQHLLDDFHKSLARSFNREDSATSTYNTEDRSRSHSASGIRLERRKPSPRRRRSSSESHSRLMDSPSAQKASALKSASSDSHAQQTSSSGLLLRNPFLHSDDNESQDDPNQHSALERRGRQPNADTVSIDDPTTPSSNASRPFVQDGLVYTDVAPPIFQHPVYGRDRPWDRIRPGPARPRAHPDPVGRPLFQRPVARAESPHLHRIPHRPSPELLERHELLSCVYLIPCMVIPPVALIYGHGYMDGIMRFHTAGEINGFRNTEKTIALCWGYGLSALCVIAVVMAMIIISASG